MYSQASSVTQDMRIGVRTAGVEYQDQYSIWPDSAYRAAQPCHVGYDHGRGRISTHPNTQNPQAPAESIPAPVVEQVADEEVVVAC